MQGYLQDPAPGSAGNVRVWDTVKSPFGAAIKTMRTDAT